MNRSKMQNFIELWTNQKQTGDSALVQSNGTKTIYINSIRIILYYYTMPWQLEKLVLDKIDYEQVSNT